MIDQTIIDAIQSWTPGSDPLSWRAEKFQALADQLFHYQYTHNQAYRTLCDNRGITPDSSPSVNEIPAVPTDAFKVAHLFSDAEKVHTFRTSGTTGEARGAHHFRTLDVYAASLHPTFQHFCNPEAMALRCLILAPPPAQMPESSLSYMLGELLGRWGDEKSRYFVDLDDQGQWQLDASALEQALHEACADNTRTMVFGTAFAFAEFFDRLHRSWQLPEGSRLMETGGFKGRTRTISRDELYQAFTDRLGIAPSYCLGEYSMTELSSQTYTDRLIAGDAATGRFYGPPWLKIDVVDPLTLSPIDTRGQVGLIRFFDLANIDSVSAIQTSDRGIVHPDGGLELLGRAPDAELRGCSLTIEEIVDQ